MALPFIRTFFLSVTATVVVGVFLLSATQHLGVGANSTPVLSEVSASYITNNSAIFNFTSNEEGTFYYLVYSAADPAPSASVIKAQGTAIAKGTGSALAANNLTEATGLSFQSLYTAYLIVENFDSPPSPSLVSEVDFTTVDETTGSVVRAEAHPTQANVNAATTLVALMPDGAQKTQFQARIAAVQADVAAVTNVESLISALPSPGDLVLADTPEVEAARSAYDSLSTYRKSLVSNFELLFFVEAFLEVITNADNIVSFAEDNPDQTNVNAAQLVLNDIPDGNVKSLLQARLDAVQDIVDAENAATAGATMALIAALPAPADLVLEDEAEVAAARTSYFNLSAFRQTLVTNYELLLGAEAQMLVLTTTDDAVSLAESTQESSDIAAAQTLVDGIPDGTMKTFFQNRLDTLQEEINTTKRITSFNFASPEIVGGIFESAGLIKLVVPSGTNRSSLTPTISITGTNVSPNSGSAQNFTSPVTYTVTALDSSTKNYQVTVTELGSGQTMPSISGGVSLNNTTPQAVVVSPTLPLTVSTSNGTTAPTLDFSLLLTNGIGSLPQTTMSTSLGQVTIPASTTITSADSGWDGVFSLPVSTNVSLSSINGQSRTVSVGLLVGSSDTSLSFNKGVRLVFNGQAGSQIGYQSPGGSFFEISSVCSSDSQAVGDALSANGDCKINVGNNLVVWTKHLTTFATYTTSSSQSGGSGGSSNSSGSSSSTASAPTCSDVKPSSTPDLFQVNLDASTARLFFAPVLGFDRYFISYSTHPSAEEHGVGVILTGTGVQNYMVSHLKPSTTYYFRVRAQNGCMPGEWSNTLRGVTRGVGSSGLVAFYKNSLLGNLIAAIRTFTFTALTTETAQTDTTVPTLESSVATVEEQSATQAAEATPASRLGFLLSGRPLPSPSPVSSSPRPVSSPSPRATLAPASTPTPVVSPSPVSTSLPSPVLQPTSPLQATPTLNFWQRLIRFFFGR